MDRVHSKETNSVTISEAGEKMADSDLCPVGTDQNVMEDRVFPMCTVGSMNTFERDNIVSTVYNVPCNKYVYLVANQSGNELSFVSSQPVMSQLDSRLSPRSAGPHSSDHVTRSSPAGAGVGTLSDLSGYA